MVTAGYKLILKLKFNRMKKIRCLRVPFVELSVTAVLPEQAWGVAQTDFVSPTQARVILEEEASVEKMPL